MDIVIRIGVILGLIYVALSAAAYIFQRQLLYFPGSFLPHPGSTEFAKAVAVSYATGDGLTLRSWYLPPPEGGHVVLLFHGNAGTIAERDFKAAHFAAAGFGVLLAEYRGYGGNPGTPAELGLYADGAAALAFLEGEGVPPARIVLYGESLGSAVAVELARGRRFAAVVLEAPFTSIPDVAARHYWFFPVRMLVEDRFTTIDKIAEVEGPLLIVHGESDTLVPPAHGRRLLAAASEPKQGAFIAGAHHNDIFLVGGAEAVMQFLGEVVARGASE